jgi:hypothetical protein
MHQASIFVFGLRARDNCAINGCQRTQDHTRPTCVCVRSPGCFLFAPHGQPGECVPFSGGWYVRFSRSNAGPCHTRCSVWGSRKIPRYGKKYEAAGRKANKTRMPLCQYDGVCSRSDCRYRHSPAEAKKATKSKGVCLPFLAGECLCVSRRHLPLLLLVQPRAG